MRMNRDKVKWVAGLLLLLVLAAPAMVRAAGSAGSDPSSSDAGTPQGKIAPEDLTPELLRNAIDKAVAALYRMEPVYTFLPQWHNQRYYQYHSMGNQALACWALLASGQSYQTPKLYRRINWVLSRDSNRTYDRAMRAKMLAMMPNSQWGPWVHRDQIWLMQAMTGQGNFANGWSGAPAKSGGDNANSQYGVLGLWATQTAGQPVPAQVWQKIDAYWRSAQEQTPGAEAAGWSVNAPKNAKGRGGAKGSGRNNFYSRISGPMTAGGVASLYITERVLRGDKLDASGKVSLSPALAKGLRWLNEHFSPDDKAEAVSPYYYYWCIQQVGTATGYRLFNHIDWFRVVTARILNQQLPNGTFREKDQSPLVSTSFALLYLSQALEPLAISKIRLGDAQNPNNTDLWNRRPDDIWNFVQFASDLYEQSTTWNVCDLSQPVYALREAPLLYLSIDQPVKLPADQLDHLRQYLRAGGLLVINLERPSLLASARQLTEAVMPGASLEAAPPLHPIYTINQYLTPSNVPMLMASNGVRPLIVCFPRDIGRALQVNNPGKNRRSRNAFLALSNVYLYAVGSNPRRIRLMTNYVRPSGRKITRTLSAVRITYKGTADPEPIATEQLKTLLANRSGVDLQISKAAPEQLKQQKIAFLTTVGDGGLDDAQAKALRHWLEAGGTLWLDACTGDAQAVAAARRIVEQIAPDAPLLPLAHDNPILTGQGLHQGFDNREVHYRRYVLARVPGIGTKPRLMGVQINGRTAIIYSPEDLTCGLAGLEDWGIYGYEPDSARHLVINGCLLALQGAAAAPAHEAMSSTSATAPVQR